MKVDFYKEIKQLVPEDGVNLNRAFPGTEMGSRSAKIAAAVETYLYPDADFLVDLHSGDIHEMVVPFAVFSGGSRRDGSKKKAAAAARAMSLSWRVASTAKNGLYSWAAQKGIPALLLERGGLGRWTEREVDAYRINLYELLVHLDNFARKYSGISQRNEFKRFRKLPGIRGASVRENRAKGDSDHALSGGTGKWILVSGYPGRKLPEKGDLLGEIRRLDGSLMYRYESELDGMVFYYTLSLGVSEGEPLVAYGEC